MAGSCPEQSDVANANANNPHIANNILTLHFIDLFLAIICILTVQFMFCGRGEVYPMLKLL